MAMAQIFKPIRWPPAVAATQEASPPAAGNLADLARYRESRVGAQPVTNTPPSGSPAAPADEPANDGSTAPDQEQAWLALIEMVFEVTGWPDAEAE
jgi:hypothetical protein